MYVYRAPLYLIIFKSLKKVTTVKFYQCIMYLITEIDYVYILRSFLLLSLDDFFLTNSMIMLYNIVQLPYA